MFLSTSYNSFFILNIDVNIFVYVLYFCSASADLSAMNALYNLFFFVQARFKPLMNQGFSLSFVGEPLPLESFFYINISINLCRQKSYA